MAACVSIWGLWQTCEIIQRHPESRGQANMIDNMTVKQSRIALVTGAAGALGAAIAKALLGEGHRVILADYDTKAVAPLAAELGDDIYPIAFDVSNPAEVKSACERSAPKSARSTFW